MSRYVIAGGRAGKERLQLLAQVMLPTTSQLLNTVGLGTGMQCLDVGCGGGHVTLLMACLVGPHGSVVGTDADGAILALARQDAEAAQLGNVEFHQADAAVCQGEEAFDLVYARFLLTHLSATEQCLEEMVKACRPTGLIVIEDIDFSGSFCYPFRIVQLMRGTRNCISRSYIAGVVIRTSALSCPECSARQARKGCKSTWCNLPTWKARVS